MEKVFNMTPHTHSISHRILLLTNGFVTIVLPIVTNPRNDKNSFNLLKAIIHLGCDCEK